MKRIVIWGLLAISWAYGQQHVELEIVGEAIKKSDIAVPDFALLERSGLYDKPWRTLNEVLRNDLIYSGYFNVLAESRIRMIKSPHIGPIDFAEWGSIEAQHLVVGSVQNKDGKMYVEVRVYEVATKQHIIAKAYHTKPELARKTAHIIADEIMLHLRNIQFATSKIIYTQERTKKMPDGDRPIKEIYMMDYDGFSPVPLTEGGLALSPSAVVSGNNTLIAYCVYEKAFTYDASYGLYFKPSLTARPQVLFSDNKRKASTPALSPDGRKVAFSIAQDGNVDIYVMNLDGSDLLRLTRHPGVDTNPSWAPGGGSLTFTSDRTGAPQIYLMDGDGLNLRRITFDYDYCDSAVYNPHYDYISFVSRFENDFDIFIMDMKTTKNYRVTRYEGSNEDPCWGPDGERLAFCSNRTGSWQLFMVNRTGENLTQITRSGNNRNPTWIP